MANGKVPEWPARATIGFSALLCGFIRGEANGKLFIIERYHYHFIISFHYFLFPQVKFFVVVWTQKDDITRQFHPFMFFWSDVSRFNVEGPVFLFDALTTHLALMSAHYLQLSNCFVVPFVHFAVNLYLLRIG